MTNFLQETLTRIDEVGKTPNDVAFIGSADGRLGCTFEQFERLADFDYDSGYGSQSIGNDLVIVFKDQTWLERSEYDGSEEWGYRSAPAIPDSHETIRNLGADGVGLWISVAETNALPNE